MILVSSFIDLKYIAKIILFHRSKHRNDNLASHNFGYHRYECIYCIFDCEVIKFLTPYIFEKYIIDIKELYGINIRAIYDTKDLKGLTLLSIESSAKMFIFGDKFICDNIISPHGQLKAPLIQNSCKWISRDEYIKYNKSFYINFKKSIYQNYEMLNQWYLSNNQAYNAIVHQLNNSNQ